MTLGEKIRKLRIEKRLRIWQLAEKIGCGTPHLSDIERGRRLPSLPTLLSIAKGLKMTVSELIEGVEDYGEVPGQRVPVKLRELMKQEEYRDEITEEWISILMNIKARGKYPKNKRQWLEIYLTLKRIFPEV